MRPAFQPIKKILTIYTLETFLLATSLVRSGGGRDKEASKKRSYQFYVLLSPRSFLRVLRPPAAAIIIG